MKMNNLKCLLVVLAVSGLAFSIPLNRRQADNSSNTTNNTTPVSPSNGTNETNVTYYPVNTRPSHIKDILLPYFPPQEDKEFVKKFNNAKLERPYFVITL